MIVEAPASEKGYWLENLLAPFETWLSRSDVTDIYVNREQEVWVETLGGSIERFTSAGLIDAVLARLARQIAAASSQGISRAHPLLSASLPDGSRIQVVGPPATRRGYAIAIRKHLSASLTLQDLEDAGTFKGASDDERFGRSGGELRPVDAGRVGEVLRQAVRDRRNILVSGGTSTGKTTFLNALLREISSAERLILIEDTPELEMTHANAVGMVAVRSELGETRVSAEDLLVAALRMRPDRIILGELRGREAFSFLRAINTGHPGSMTTIHADSPLKAIEQLVLLVLQSGSQLRREDIQHYVRQSIDVFVQLDRVGGKRHVTQVLELEHSHA